MGEQYVHAHQFHFLPSVTHRITYSRLNLTRVIRWFAIQIIILDLIQAGRD
jgi:hypothetical protein